MKRWSVALACASLALTGIAGAEPPRPVELPTAVPLEIAVDGLEQAVSADPSIVRADADVERGVLTLTGLLLNQQSVVYAFTAGGVVAFIARVVAPPPPVAARPAALAADAGRGSFYRLTVGSGFRDTPEGWRRLPLTVGGSAGRPIGSDRLTFRGTTNPLADDNADQRAAGSAVLQWTGPRYRLALGDQPVDLAPQLLTSFPLRGLGAEGRAGPLTVALFGGARATPQLTLAPQDDDPLPATLAGIKTTWVVAKDLRLSGAFAMAETSPVASLGGEWQHGIWSLALETAATPERLGAGLRLRRETEALTLEQRLTHRTAGVSPLLPGSDGLTSETAATHRFYHGLSVIGRLSVMPPLAGGADAWPGGWYLGGDWEATDGLRLALGVGRAFDGSVTTLGGTVDARSRLLGTATMTVTRTLHDGPSAAADSWHETARVERPVGLKPFARVFLEESLTHSDVQGSLSVSAGAEVEAGWLRASLAPGVVIPTVTDPNGVAQTLRLRVTATPHPALQVHAELRQTFGARPDTTVQFGVGAGVGGGAPWSAVTSWFARATVEGVVFVDQNGNGRWDPGEPGLPGVPVQIDAERTALTDGDGRYRFTGVRHGSYHVAVDRQALPPHLRLASASPVALRLPDGPRTVSFAFVGSGAIHGVVFNDLALTGRFSGTEPGVPATLVLEGPGTRRSLSVAGAFSLGGLTPGRYRLAVDALSLPPAHVADTPPVEIEIRPGDVATAQFPVVALRALAVTACLGRGGSGPCTAADAPAAGLRLGAGPSAAATDAQGRALVRQLPAGRVTLTVDPASVPPGWAPPAPVTVELPDGPTTERVTIRLRPAAPR